MRSLREILESRKAQGMSLSVIVIAVIVLVILIVLILIFSGRISIFSSGTTDTASQYTGNKCMVPGTSNECESDADRCRQAGGSFDDIREWDDCRGEGCCLK